MICSHLEHGLVNEATLCCFLWEQSSYFSTDRLNVRKFGKEECFASFVSQSDLSHSSLGTGVFVSEILVVHGHWKLRNKLVLRLIAQEVAVQVKEKVKSKIMQNKVNCPKEGQFWKEASYGRERLHCVTGISGIILILQSCILGENKLEALTNTIGH